MEGARGSTGLKFRTPHEPWGLGVGGGRVRNTSRAWADWLNQYDWFNQNVKGRV